MTIHQHVSLILIFGYCDLFGICRLIFEILDPDIYTKTQ